MKVFYCTLCVSIALIVGGFLVPPLGIIDGSVLTAVGELLAFATLAQVPQTFKHITITKGDFKIEVSSNNHHETKANL